MIFQINLRVIICIVLILLGGVSCGGKSDRVVGTDNNLLASLHVKVQDSTHGVRLYPETDKNSNWLVYRVWPQGYNAIYYSFPKMPLVPVADNGFTRLLPRKFLEHNSDLFMVAYSTDKYKSGNRQPVEVWKFDSVTGKANLLAENLVVGGIEGHLHVSVGSDWIDICDQDSCVSIDYVGQQTNWIINNDLVNRVIVEATFTDDGVFTILRSDIATIKSGVPPYSIRFLPRQTSGYPARTVANVSDCIPFNLRIENSEVKWSCARTRQEIAELMQFDLRRLPHGGLSDLGLPNKDGRIAWSQIYTVGTLLNLSAKYTPKLWHAGDWSEFKLLASSAVSLIAKQGESDLSGFYATRYSVGQEPLLFAVHLGRIAAFFDDARADGITTPFVELVSAAVHFELVTLMNTLETMTQIGGFHTLSFRRGAAFWADGVNTPYNLLSAYALGLLSSGKNTHADVILAKQIMAPIITVESLSTDSSWHYWWGLGASGWTADMEISTNTPNYNGNVSIADISYRSMDAVALLKLAGMESNAVPLDIVNALREYVMTGRLLPSVNLYLIRMGTPVVLNEAAAMVRARSAAPWEIHDQLFALESLMDSWAR